MKAINSPPPVPCPADYNIQPARLPFEIINPPKFTVGNIVSVAPINIPHGTKYRYLFNFEVQSFVDCMKRYGRDIHGTSEQKECNAYYMFLTELVNQTRGVNISRIVLSIMLLSKAAFVDGSDMRLHRCEACINPFFFYFNSLFDNYVLWPFLDTSTSMIYTGQRMSTQLIHLTYSLLNRFISFYTGTLPVSMFNVCMGVYYEWARTSLDDEHLLTKGDLTKCLKLLNEVVKDIEVITYDQHGMTGTRKLSSAQEYWYHDEKQQIMKFINNDLKFIPYTQIIKQILASGIKDVDTLIALRMGLECAANNSCFKITLPLLEFDRSVKARVPIYIIPDYPPTQVYKGFPIKLNLKGVIKGVYDQLLRAMGDIQDDRPNRDFEREFIERLTNKSSGTAKDVADRKRQQYAKDGFIGSIPLTQRYVGFLLDREQFYNVAESANLFSEVSMAGIRSAINRRERLIYQTGNKTQSIHSPLQTMGKLIAKVRKEIASGKQTGSVTDMLKGLAASSDEATLISDSDIRGMDASSQEILMAIMMSVLFQWVGKYKIKTYFWGTEREVDIECYDLEGRALPKIRTKLNGLQVYIAELFAAAKNNTFKFLDMMYTAETYVSAAGLLSGLFSTGEHNNLVIMSLLRHLDEDLGILYPNVSVEIIKQIFGDDASLYMKLRDGLAMPHDVMTNILDRIRDYFQATGYEIDPESSAHMTTFLQQSAVFGKVSPKHARLSLYTAERGESRVKDPLDQNREIRDICDELSARCILSERCLDLAISLWVVSRSYRMNLSSNDQVRTETKVKLAKAIESYHLRTWIKITDSHLYIRLPYVMLYMPECIGQAPPRMHSNLYGTIISSYYTPRGTYFYWLIGRVCRKHYRSDEYIKQYAEEKARYDSKIKSRVSSGQLSPESGDVLMGREYYIPLNRRLDQNVLHKMGLKLASIIYSSIPKSFDLSKQQESDPKIRELFKRARDDLDPIKAARSYESNKKLSLNGFSIPYTILYTSGPEMRVKQAFKLQMQKRVGKKKLTLQDSTFIKELLNRLNNYAIENYEMEDDAIIDFDVVESPELIEFAPESEILKKVSLLPCGGVDTMYNYLNMILGTPFNEDSQGSIVEAVRGQLTVGADVDLVLKAGAKIYTKRPDLLYDFYYSIGVDESDFSRMTVQLESYLTVGSVSWQAIMNARKYFTISVRFTAGDRLGKLEYGRSMPKNLVPILTVIYYTMFLAQARCNKLKVNPSRAFMQRLLYLWR
uniref:RNA-dependent RNA polymerase n=1 Tax=French Guiana reovirus TaxID=2803189 RepID=A0A7T8G1Z7_9REOV|nr:RNA-dependent RNA polymerase [French Guiana reovirus]